MADGGSAEAEAEGHVKTSHQAHDGKLQPDDTHGSGWLGNGLRGFLAWH